MDGTLEVTPATLHARAGTAQGIGASVSGLADRADDACDQAAERHGTWHFGTELASLGPLWRRQLTGQGAALSGDAAKLNGSAGTYAAAENRNITLARSAFPPTGAGT